MSIVALYRWGGGALASLDYCDPAEYVTEAVDSFLVTDATALAPGLHRERFLHAARIRGRALEDHAQADIERFWDAAVAAVPVSGSWFPRFELQSKTGSGHLLLRLRPAPELARSAVLTTHAGPDPRTAPSLKGPDIDVLVAARTAARLRGADDAVLTTREGYVVDGTTSAIVWWRGDILCAPPAPDNAPEFARVDSVTAKSLLALATALGIPTHHERVTPTELAGTEVWSLSALHGIRIVTAWIDGPPVAELPGRLTAWRQRLDALRKPLGALTP